MWIRREFQWVTSSEHDLGPGWRDVKTHEFDPARTFGIAHDVLEHFDQSGTIEEEARAFGAILWGRGQSSWWATNNPHASRYSFGEVMGDECMESMARAGVIKPVGALPLDFPEYEDEIDSLLRNAKRALEGYAESYSYDTSRANEDLRNFANWVRIGFRRAERRWGRWMTHHQFMDLFDGIANESIFSDGYEPESELDRVVVSVSPKLCKYVIREVPYVDPFDY